jgi:hypothetical protein
LSTIANAWVIKRQPVSNNHHYGQSKKYVQKTAIHKVAPFRAFCEKKDKKVETDLMMTELACVLIISTQVRKPLIFTDS